MTGVIQTDLSQVDVSCSVTPGKFEFRLVYAWFTPQFQADYASIFRTGNCIVGKSSNHKMYRCCACTKQNMENWFYSVNFQLNFKLNYYVEVHEMIVV